MSGLIDFIIRPANSVAQGQSQARALMLQSRNLALQSEQQELAARSELARGREEGNQVREALLRSVAAQRARYAAAGIALDAAGTPDVVEEATLHEGQREMATRRTNAELRAAATRIQGSQSRANSEMAVGQASLARATGGLNAAINLFESADRTASRITGAR